MNISIINIDSKIPNLALKKIEKYHIDRGDTVSWDNEIIAHVSDKVYVSCIFTKNRHKCLEWVGRADIGGTGWDIKKRLPPEIDSVKPRINWGFTTRGCIRKCPFCFVPEKEGNIHIVGDIYDIWDGKSKELTIMDNNILASGDHFFKICQQIKKEKIIVDFNQGLDVRLLTDEMCAVMKSIRHKEYKFSWDGKERLADKFRWVYEKLGRCTIFVICGFPVDNFNDVMRKFITIKRIGHNGYCMRHENVSEQKKYISLARWVNQHNIFQKMSFCQFRRHERKLIKEGEML